MTEEQTKEIFGNDVQLACFTGYDVEKEGGDVLSITINFDEDDLSEGFLRKLSLFDKDFEGYYRSLS